MDVVEIGSTQLEMGGVYEVKVLGVYAMIDDGELDWKVITINVNDPKASKVNNVEVSTHHPVAAMAKERPLTPLCFASLHCLSW